jgi:transposase
MVAYLSGQAHLSKRQIEEIIQDAYGASISLGSIVTAQQTVSEAVAGPVEEAQAYVQNQAVVNADETGWKEETVAPGRRRKAWLWVAVTQWVTVFLIHASRGTVAARELLGRFAGYLVTDRWNAYNAWPVRMRQICWSHLIRDFTGFLERGKRSAPIGEALLREARKMFALWRRVRDGTLARSTFRTYLGPIRRRVERLLRRGTRCGEAKTEGMCVMILKLAPALWTFARVEGVEPTNNTAERAVRPAVLYRKGCFGTQSAAGSRFVGRILTVVATLRQQGRNVMDYLTLACARAYLGRKAPSLLPRSARAAAA